MAKAKKKIAKRKKKAPAGMTGVQRDAVADMHEKKLASVPQALKDGSIDHADAADPSEGRGVLDPEKFDEFSHEFRATGSETQRIAKVICAHLDEHYSAGGRYTWEAGFFLETDPRSQGAEGHQVLNRKMIGDAWSEQLQHELGLTEYEGALCWMGRGTTERHIICVKTTQLQERQLQATAEASQHMISQPEGVGGKNKPLLEIDETVKKLPLVPVQEGTSENGAPTKE